MTGHRQRLLALARTLRGSVPDEHLPTDRLRDLSEPHAESSVWACRCVDGATRIVKWHASARAFAQERDAYHAHAPALAHTAVCLAAADVDDAWPESARTLRGALLLTRLAGRRPDVIDARLAGDAGAWLRALHERAPSGDDPMPLGDALRRRLDAWQRRGAALPGVADEVHDVVERARCAIERALADAPRRWTERVPAHRDFQSRNWLSDAGRLTGVLDFEHARADGPLTDWSKLVTARWWPAHGAAFCAGYGADPLVEAPLLTHVFAALHALATTVWAARHDDATFADEGRRLVPWVRARLGR